MGSNHTRADSHDRTLAPRDWAHAQRHAVLRWNFYYLRGSYLRNLFFIDQPCVDGRSHGALAALHKISRWRTAFAVLAPPVVMISVSVWFVYSTVVGFWNIYNSKTPMNFPPMPTNSQPIVAPNTPTTTPSSASTDVTDPATTSTTSQPIDAPTKNPDPVIAAPTSTQSPTQDPAPPNPPKKTSNDSAAILNITHGI